jgi:hypothetical protein
MSLVGQVERRPCRLLFMRLPQLGLVLLSWLPQLGLLDTPCPPKLADITGYVDRQV